MNLTFRLSVLVGAFALVTAAHAQWSYVSLKPTPGYESTAGAVSATQQGGTVRIGYNGRASLWSGTPDWTDLTPASAQSGAVNAIDGATQSGYVFQSGSTRASLWHGDAASWTDLTPAGASDAYVNGARGGQQVGGAVFSGDYHVALWTGSAASYVDLTPAGDYAVTEATATDGVHQVGYVRGAQSSNHAGMWSGTAASFTDLHPAGYDASGLSGVSDGQEAGGATTFSGDNHAGVWSGTAGSFVDLNPAGATSSAANGVSHGIQAGEALFGSNYLSERAGVWEGTAGSWFNLGSLLPSPYTYSAARAVYSDGAMTYVVGFAQNSRTGLGEAILWMRPNAVPEPAPFAALGFSAFSLLRRRSRRS